MPHESTVQHEDILPREAVAKIPGVKDMDDSVDEKRKQRLVRTGSVVTNLYAPVPRQFTQVQEDDEIETETDLAKWDVGLAELL